MFDNNVLGCAVVLVGGQIVFICEEDIPDERQLIS